MNPCEINVLITAITNHLFCTLSKENFICLNIFLSELSKSMFATTLFRDLCDKNEKLAGRGEHEKESKNEKEDSKNESK